MRAEEKIFALVEKVLNVQLEKNPKLYLANNEYTYMLYMKLRYEEVTSQI
jgi:hypothetical protein